MLSQLCKIHGLLKFDGLEEEIIRHKGFNRLADIKQLGYTYKGAFKGATHTRLTHALGTAHLAKKIWMHTIDRTQLIVNELPHVEGKILPGSDELQQLKNHEVLVGACGLLHDINHIPYAHSIQDHLKLEPDLLTSKERFLKNINHFKDCKGFSEELISKTAEVLIDGQHKNFTHADLIYEIIRGEPWGKLL